MKTLCVMLILLSSLFIGCATATPYKPGSEKEPGYRDLKIEKNKFRISFLGNSSTTRETVEVYLLYRAAEITQREGFDYFVMNEQNTDTQVKISSSPALYSSFNFGPSPYRRRYGYPYYAVGYPWATNVSSQTNYEAIAYVTLFKGAPGDKPNAYEAKEVMGNLDSEIQRPKQ